MFTSGRSGSGVGRNKLRPYRQIKTTFGPEEYCKIILPRYQMSAFAKVRCGTAPLRIETDRCERLPVNERLSPFCNDKVESEFNAVMECFIYEDIRVDQFEKNECQKPTISHNDNYGEVYFYILKYELCTVYCQNLL
jgi:hypothetical protein